MTITEERRAEGEACTRDLGTAIEHLVEAANAATSAAQLMNQGQDLLASAAGLLPHAERLYLLTNSLRARAELLEEMLARLSADAQSVRKDIEAAHEPRED